MKDVREALLADVVSLFRGAQKSLARSRAAAARRHSRLSFLHTTKLFQENADSVMQQWLDAQDSFNLSTWLARQPSVDVEAWLQEVRGNNSFSTSGWFRQQHDEKITEWLGHFRPFNLSAWLASQVCFILAICRHGSLQGYISREPEPFVADSGSLSTAKIRQPCTMKYLKCRLDGLILCEACAFMCVTTRACEPPKIAA